VPTTLPFRPEERDQGKEVVMVCRCFWRVTWREKLFPRS
jgi:hypothetical protein